ncbi:Hypothetical predicted protein [Podarcis lilfordi]|uniref:Uncharacterized protein n=1 Tax=Podarcis lilfordi TaxID=74358 RepID=A0AA35PA06_9SAUR|nr:Hypothetical predicted protein [Podarcis lilfordi]
MIDSVPELSLTPANQGLCWQLRPHVDGANELIPRGTPPPALSRLPTENTHSRLGTWIRDMPSEGSMLLPSW